MAETRAPDIFSLAVPSTGRGREAGRVREENTWRNDEGAREEGQESQAELLPPSRAREQGETPPACRSRIRRRRKRWRWR